MKFFLILKCFLKEEIKLNFRRIKILYIFVKEFSILRFFFTYLIILLYQLEKKILEIIYLKIQKNRKIKVILKVQVIKIY